MGGAKMIVRVFEYADEVADSVATTLADTVRQTPNVVLGLATGATMIPVYKKLVALSQESKLSWNDVKVFMLDEYVGCARSNPMSYAYYMTQHFIEPIGFPRESFNIPDGSVKNQEEMCLAYEEKIFAVGGIDVQLLGLGRNGHIGFNEPGSSPDSRTRVVNLHPQTIKVNSVYVEGDLPQQAVSMGIATIMAARRILLVATGKEKSEIVGRLLASKETSKGLPASFLHSHPDTSLVLDQEAYIR